jgi:hypothetical protein
MRYFRGTYSRKEHVLIMRRYLTLLLFSFLLAACGSVSELAVPSPAAEEETPPTPVAPTVAGGSPTDPVGATPLQEAAIVRDSDWVLGPAEPAVTIIEYGDFQ